MMSETMEDPPRRRPLPRASIERIFRHESARLTRFFARRTQCPSLAQDLTQDAFVRLARAQVEGDPLPYLQRIASNLLISWSRHESRWRALVADGAFDEAAKSASPPEQLLAIEVEDVRRQYQQVIDRLPEKTRRIYLMHRLEGLTYLEISQKMELSVKSVEYHIASALKALVRGVDQA